MALFRDRLLPFFEIEVFDGFALGFFPADDHSIEMGYFPEFWVDGLPRLEDKFELGEQFLVLFSVLQVVL